MEKRECPDLGRTEQRLSDQDLDAVTGGTQLVAGLGGPDTRTTGEWIIRRSSDGGLVT